MNRREGYEKNMGNGKENDRERKRNKERETSVKRKYSSTVKCEQLLYNIIIYIILRCRSLKLMTTCSSVSDMFSLTTIDDC